MTDRKTLYDGLSRAAWGYLFLYLDFTLNNISLLPRFVGWLLFLAAIEKLKEARRDLALLRPLGAAMAIWTALDWAVSWTGAEVDGRFLLPDLLAAVAELYFHFQFLTDMAALAEAHHPDGPVLSRRIRLCRTAQAVLVTLFSLASYLPARLSGAAVGVPLSLLAIAYCVLGICLTAFMFTLRSAFQGAAPPGGGGRI